MLHASPLLALAALLSAVAQDSPGREAPAQAPAAPEHATDTPAPDSVVRMTVVPQGAMGKIKGGLPQRASFGAERPSAAKRIPEGLKAPQFGTLGVAGGTLFVLDEPEGAPATLIVDTNRNGDLTDDAPATWSSHTSRSAKQADGTERTSTVHNGNAMVDIGEPGKPLLVSLSLVRFDKDDPARVAMKSILVYYRDYGYEGTIELGGKKYKAQLSDESARGDFRGGAGEDARVVLLIDVDQNGTLDSRSEAFDSAKPFNIGGQTWELADMARDGSSFRIVKSARSVAEAPMAATVGKPMRPFEAKDTAGNIVKFPQDYAGKIVLVDFWATWCQPCMREMPAVVAAYEKYKPMGFDVLGISLDFQNTVGRIPSVTSGAKMTWRQIADGQGWQGALARKYSIEQIPAAFLVDGTTGMVLAKNLRGEALGRAIESALVAPGRGSAAPAGK